MCVSRLHDCPCHCWRVGITVQLHCGLAPFSCEDTRAWCSLAAYLLRRAVRKSQTWPRKEPSESVIQAAASDHLWECSGGGTSSTGTP
eukprot:COSAG01_NODE_1523_length_10022_cov_6.693339_7_plen_88_part_00